MRYLIIFLLLISSAKAQIPAGVFNQMLGLAPLSKQCWISFASSVQAVGDSGITLNYRGNSGTFYPTLAADGSYWGYDMFVQGLGGAIQNMGGSVPAPLDLNRYCYYLIGNSYIGLTISYAPAKDKFDVYFYVQHEQSEGSLAEIYLNPPTSLLTLPAPGYPIDASLNYSNLIKGTNTGLTPGVDHQVRIYRDRSINNTNLFVHAIIIVDKN